MTEPSLAACASVAAAVAAGVVEARTRLQRRRADAPRTDGGQSPDGDDDGA